MKRHQNLFLLAAVALLTALPLALAGAPQPGASTSSDHAFVGTDDRAKSLIGEIAPHYRPWFAPILEPATGEIASLLLALEASLGAGFLGYAFGVFITRENLRHLKQEQRHTEGLPTC